MASRLSARVGRAGAVALVTALTAPVLVLIVGFAADYGYASYINQRLARATDSATLGSVSQTAATVAGGYDKLSALQNIGVNYFNANIAQLPVSNVSFSLSVVSDGNGGVIATGTYSYNSPTFFSSVLGFSNIPLSGTAKTSARPPIYANYYVLVDTSQSMGIGATQADMTALYNRVKQYNNASVTDGGCVFGCHVLGRISAVPLILQQYTNEDLAHNSKYGAPITLRIDSAVTAINSIVGTAAQVTGSTKNVKFGLYGIGIDPTTSKRITSFKDPPSNDYSAVQTAASTIDLGNTTGTSNSGNTDFSGEFSDFLAGSTTPGQTITPPTSQGSGASATSPLNYIFIITDGLTDVTGSFGTCLPYGLCTAPIDPSSCTSLKAVATVVVIYTTYNPIYQFNTPPVLEARYASMADGKVQQISNNLQSCATSADWFFKADDGPTLVAAMQALFAKTLPVTARITQ